MNFIMFCHRNLCLWLFLYIYTTLTGVHIQSSCLSNSLPQHPVLYVRKDIAVTQAMNMLRLGCQGQNKVKQTRVHSNFKFYFGRRLIPYVAIAAMTIYLSGDVESNPGPASINMTPNTQQSHSFLKSRGLKSAHINIRSILGKMDTLKISLNENPFDVLTISETWLTSNISDDEISIPGYSLTRNNRIEKHGGGMLAFVKNTIPYKTRVDLLNKNIESTVIVITRPKSKSLFILTIYRAPDQPLETFTHELHTALSSIPLDAEIVLLGDFNMHFLAKQNDSSRPLKRKLLNLTSTYNLEQIIDKPTRITETSNTLIDLLFVNNNHRITASGVLHVSLSDHSLIYCVIKAGVIHKWNKLFIDSGPYHNILLFRDPQ